MFLRRIRISHYSSLCYNSTRNFASGSSINLPLKFERFGDQNSTNPLIIVHGLFGHKQNWRSVAKALQAKLKNMVYTIDLRNHGESPHHPEHNYKSMAGDLWEFIESEVVKTTEISRVFLLGHSMGGKVVAELALHQSKSNLIEKLIIEDVTPNRGMRNGFRSPFAKYIQAMKSIDLRKSRKEIDELLSLTIEEQDVRQFLLTNLKRTESGAQRWLCNLDALEESMEEIMAYSVDDTKTFDKPTLFIAGQDSRYLIERDKISLEKIFTKSRFISIQGAGHWVHSQQPRIFIDCVTEFLARNELPEELRPYEWVKKL